MGQKRAAPVPQKGRQDVSENRPPLAPWGAVFAAPILNACGGTALATETTFSKDDIKYMKAALKQAEKALALGEVPIGAVIVENGRIIGRGYNRRNTDHTTLAHAEITAIRKANRKVGDWRLEGCTLYVTLEPCQMCAGALVQSRIDRVVIGAPSYKSGCGGTLLNILQNEEFNHQVEMTTGVMQEECTQILQKFFKELLVQNKMRKKAASSLPSFD